MLQPRNNWTSTDRTFPVTGMSHIPATCTYRAQWEKNQSSADIRCLCLTQTGREFLITWAVISDLFITNSCPHCWTRPLPLTVHWHPLSAAFWPYQQEQTKVAASPGKKRIVRAAVSRPASLVLLFYSNRCQQPKQQRSTKGILYLHIPLCIYGWKD